MQHATSPIVHRARGMSGMNSGRLRVRAVSAAAAEAALELGGELASAGATRGEVVRFLDEPCYLKASALAPRAALRHGLRGWLLRSAPPRVREFDNLRWMAGRLFQAAEAVAAGCVVRLGLPRFQFLLTRVVPEAVELGVFLDASSDEERGRVLDELARETARLHALHFVHHDLFPRNVLVRSGIARRVYFLDAWAGGPGTGRRGAAYDLACLFLDGAEILSTSEQLAFLRRYLAECEVQERPRRPAPFLRSIARARRAQVELHERQPARRRGAPLATRDWPPAELVRALVDPEV